MPLLLSDGNTELRIIETGRNNDGLMLMMKRGQLSTVMAINKIQLKDIIDRLNEQYKGMK